MLYARPVIASRIGDIDKFVDDGLSGFLVHPQDHVGFAEKTIYLLSNRDKAQAMGKAAAEKIKKICAEENILDKLNGVYLTLEKAANAGK